MWLIYIFYQNGLVFFEFFTNNFITMPYQTTCQINAIYKTVESLQQANSIYATMTHLGYEYMEVDFNELRKIGACVVFWVTRTHCICFINKHKQGIIAFYEDCATHTSSVITIQKAAELIHRVGQLIHAH
jgi:hypothetical protein